MNTLAKLIFFGIMMIVIIISLAIQIAALPQAEQVVAIILVATAVVVGILKSNVVPTAAKYHKIALFYRMNILFITIFLIYKIFSGHASLRLDVYLITLIIFMIAALILMQNSEAILQKKEEKQSKAQFASC